MSASLLCFHLQPENCLLASRSQVLKLNERIPHGAAQKYRPRMLGGPPIGDSRESGARQWAPQSGTIGERETAHIEAPANKYKCRVQTTGSPGSRKLHQCHKDQEVKRKM